MTLTALHGVTYDATGRRIPVLHFVKDDNHHLMKVIAWPQGFEFHSMVPTPQEVMPMFLKELAAFVGEAEALAAVPPPKQHPPTPKKAKATKPTPRAKKSTSTFPHPSHYPAKVFEGAPPPPPPGGWPKDAGIWEEAARNPHRDEYGPKGSRLIDLPDQPGGGRP